MRAVIQRVKKTSLSVGGQSISEIEGGLAVYLAVSPADGEKSAELMAKKIAMLRVFEDEQGKMNLSVQDVRGEVLLVSQFTLCGDVRKGNRPSFTEAERPERANALYLAAAGALRGQGVPVKLGVFGAHMFIEQVNDGPVTIIYEI